MRVFALDGTYETTQRGYRVGLLIATAFVLIVSVASSPIAVGAAGADATQTPGASVSQAKQVPSATPDSSLHQQSTDSVSRITFEYSYFGGNVNLEINDQRRADTDLAAFDGTTVGGATVEVPREPDSSQSEGRVVVTGDIDSFSVGGQEFTIDNVTFGQPDDPSATVEFDSLSPTQSRYAVGDTFTASPSEVNMSIEPYTFPDGEVYRDGTGYRRDGDDPVFAPGNVNLRFNISSIPTESEDTVTIVTYDVQAGTTTDRTVTRTEKTFPFDDATLPADEDVPFPTVADGYRRRNVTETNQYPWSAVGQVVGNVSKENLPGVSVCSGTVIENNHVLTSAHCVYDTTTDEWLSSRGADQDTPPLFNESVNITQIQTYKKYTKDGDQTGNRTYDLAVLTLDENVGPRTGTFGYTARLPENSRFDRSAHVTGYPLPRAGYVNRFKERWDLIAEGEGIGVGSGDCDGSKSARCHIFRTGGDSGSLTLSGYSGGPVWENSITGPDILSVLSAGTGKGWKNNLPGVDDYTIGIRISEDTYSDISKMVEHGRDVPQSPIAVANGPYSVDEGDSVPLRKNGSTDPAGSLTEATWTVTSGPGSITNSTYQSPANVSRDTQATVTLTVTGSNGRTDTATATVNIRTATDDADAPSVTIEDQQATGQAETVTVAGATAPEAYVIAVHEADDSNDDALSFDIRGVSEPFAAGASATDVTIELDEPITQSQTVTAMLHAVDAAAADNLGAPLTIDGESVSETATLTVDTEGTDLERFDQDADGELGFGDVLDTITAHNDETAIGGEPVSFEDVLDVIAAHNGA